MRLGRSVEERVVLITGAGQRLGAATAARLMDEGVHVLVHARSSIDAAQALVDEATARNGEVRGTVVRADLTVDADVDALIETVKAHPQGGGLGPVRSGPQCLVL